LLQPLQVIRIIQTALFEKLCQIGEHISLMHLNSHKRLKFFYAVHSGSQILQNCELPQAVVVDHELLILFSLRQRIEALLSPTYLNTKERELPTISVVQLPQRLHNTLNRGGLAQILQRSLHFTLDFAQPVFYVVLCNN